MIEWFADGETLRRLTAALTLQAGRNAAVVAMGAALLGLAAGIVGAFVFLRGRALVSDALSHATLPGVALAFLAGAAFGLETRSLPLLLAGAAVTGALGAWLVQALTQRTRLTEDAAIGAVLSVLYGLGVVLLSYVQSLPFGGQAGLQTFILGQAATMRMSEAVAMGALAALAVAATLAFFKEFRLLCFDQDFARQLGWPIRRLDLAMAGLATLVTVAGLQTVGLVLIVALLIVPPVAARFWSERLSRILIIGGAFGAASAYVGAAASYALPDMPTGAAVVLTAGVFFLISLFFAPQRGLVAEAWRRARLRRRLLFAKRLAQALREPVRLRSLTALELRLRGLIDGGGRVTARGEPLARAVDRNLRLWQAQLRLAPQDAPPNVRWGVDPIDAVLPPDGVARLEREVDMATEARP